MTRLPLLTPQQVDALGKITPAAERWWQLVLSAASAAREGREDTSPNLAAWNLLLMAAGNFKRQTPISPIVTETPWPVVEPAESEDHVSVPDRPPLWRDKRTSWSVLDSIGGLGIPTASTVLAALWPNHHAIVDKRAMTSAVGLAGYLKGWDATPVRHGHTTKLPRHSWDHYDWYRQEVIETANAGGMTLTAVERALYRLHAKVGTVRGRSWADYGEALVTYLRSADDQPS